MYAAAPGAVARDGDRAIFVNELIKEIRNPGRIEEAFNRTLVGVSRSSQGEQIPWFSSSLVEDFSFATSARATPQPAPPVVEVEKKPAAPPPVAEVEKEPAAPPPDPDANARREYQSAERVGTKKGWEDFVPKHPSGRYADLAREQIAKLTPPLLLLPCRSRRRPRHQGARRPRSAQSQLIRWPTTSAVSSMRNAAITPVRSKDFDEVLRLNPRDAEALNNRCWARAGSGELQPALKDCDNALEVRPRYLDAHDSRGFRQSARWARRECHYRLRRSAEDQSQARLVALWTRHSQVADRQCRRRQRRHRSGEAIAPDIAENSPSCRSSRLTAGSGTEPGHGSALNKVLPTSADTRTGPPIVVAGEAAWWISATGVSETGGRSRA